jgi:hypothetical protein
MADQSRSLLWIDAGGRLTITRIRTDAGAATIQADMLAVSNADWANEWEGNLNINMSPAPAGGDYGSVQQAAMLNFLCADNSIVGLRLIAPQVGIFLADKVTIDATMIATLIADCIGHLESTTGSLAASFLGGSLITKG